MGYPQRFYETGNIYHLTARCHDKTFLLKAAYYRQIFVNVLFFKG
jgi:putative transposase